MKRILRAIIQFQIPVWLAFPCVVLALMVGLSGGYLVGQQGFLAGQASCPEGPEICSSFANFWKVWNLVDKNFVDPSAIQPQKMIDGAIEGMLDTLGDEGHTRYLPAETAKAERESLNGKFEGIGAYIDVRNDQPIIVQPIDGSPAEKAGIKPGDLILKVDGEDVYGVTVDELRNKVRGPKGSSVVLTMQHEGATDTYDVTVTRDEITVPSVSWRMLENDIAYLRLNQFSTPSPDQMKEAVTAAQQQGAKGMILDLRNNPGGYVNALNAIAGQFLPKDTTVLLEQDRSGTQTPMKTDAQPIAPDLPLVVLVNNNTASSAEILAGALKEHQRAEVIGVPTFGTATVLRSFDLDGGAQLRLGTTQWLTPNGEVVRGKGITPSQVVELPSDASILSPAEAAEMTVEQLQQNADTQFVSAFDLMEQTVLQSK